MTDVSQAPETPEIHAERLIDGLLRGLFAVRIPLALGVLSVLVLTLSDQVLEVHRVLMEKVFPRQATVVSCADVVAALG